MGRCWESGLDCVSRKISSFLISHSYPVIIVFDDLAWQINEIESSRLTYWCRMSFYRRAGPRRQRSKSGQLLLRRGAGLGRGEPGALHPAQLLRH